MTHATAETLVFGHESAELVAKMMVGSIERNQMNGSRSERLGAGRE